MATDVSLDAMSPLFPYTNQVEIISLSGFFSGRHRFDFVAAHSVLEHLSDPVEVLKKLYDQANPGAAVFLSVPNFESFFSKQDLWSHPFYAYPDHLNYFTAKSLSLAMSLAGFEVIKIEAVTPPWVGEYIARNYLQEQTHFELFDILNNGIDGEYLWGLGLKL